MYLTMMRIAWMIAISSDAAAIVPRWKRVVRQHDAVTGEFVIAAQVVSEVQLLTLPTIRIDPADPFLLYDAVPQDPAAAGMATMKYLEDNTEASYEQRWGLTVSLNASTNPACEPYLEEIYGPF